VHLLKKKRASMRKMTLMISKVSKKISNEKRQLQKRRKKSARRVTVNVQFSLKKIWLLLIILPCLHPRQTVTQVVIYKKRRKRRRNLVVILN
jgi:hypothetical protein